METGISIKANERSRNVTVLVQEIETISQGLRFEMSTLIFFLDNRGHNILTMRTVLDGKTAANDLLAL